jgi:TM2 domain-containing membrane protein YozV
MNKNIYLSVRGKKTGPHDISDIRRMLGSGEASLYDIAEVDGSKTLLQNILTEQVEVVSNPIAVQPPELSVSPLPIDSDSPVHQNQKPISRFVPKAPPPPPPLTQSSTFFCKHCGNQVISAAVICTSCGAPTGNGAANVPMTVNINPLAYSNRKSRVAYVLLAFFVGGLGIHNFYSGHIMSGLFKILLSFFGFFTFGVTWLLNFVIVLIEMCTVTQDSNGIPFN